MSILQFLTFENRLRLSRNYISELVQGLNDDQILLFIDFLEERVRSLKWCLK